MEQQHVPNTAAVKPQHTNQQPRWPRGLTLSCLLIGIGQGTSQFLARKTMYGFELIQGCHTLTADRTPIHRHLEIHGHPQAELSQYCILEVCWDPVSTASYRVTDLHHVGDQPWQKFSEIASKLSSNTPWLRQAVRNLHNLKPVPVNGLDAQKRWEQAKARLAWWANSANVRAELGTDKFTVNSPAVVQAQPAKVAVVPSKPAAVICKPIVFGPPQPTPAGCGRVVIKRPAKAHTMRTVTTAQLPMRLYEDRPEKSQWHVQIPDLKGIYAVVARSQFRQQPKTRYHNSAVRHTAPHRPQMALA